MQDLEREDLEREYKKKRFHIFLFVIIAVILIIVGGLISWFYPKERSISDRTLEESNSEMLFTTNTMICEGFEDDVCKIREGNIFEKGESIFVVTRIIPKTDDVLSVNVLFMTDIILPNETIIENFLGGHNFRREIWSEKAYYILEIKTSEEELIGEHKIIITMMDRIGLTEKIVEKKFSLL